MKILLSGNFQILPNIKREMERLGCQILFVEDERMLFTGEKEEIEGVICNSFFQYNNIFEFPKLKFIQLLSAGLDRVPLDYIEKNQIKLYRASGVYHIPIAEWTVLGILYFYKELDFFCRNKSDRIWLKNRNLLELYNKKVCIIGCGEIGTEIAKRLKSFGCRIYGVDLEKKNRQEYDQEISLENIDEAIQISDIIVLTLPLNKNTYHIINKERLLYMRDSLLVNVSRGGLVDEEELISVLEKKQIRGAVLDVFEREPISADSKIWQLDNVLLSPHNSFVSEGNNKRLNEILLNNIKLMRKDYEKN